MRSLFRYLVIYNIGNSFFTAVSLFISVRTAKQRQHKAYAGDADAAKRIVLPCYQPLVIGLAIFYLLFAVALSLTFADTRLRHRDRFRIIEFFHFCVVAVYTIVPMVLVQPSVSTRSFWKTFFLIFPWWLFCSLLWGLSSIDGPSSFPLSSLFTVFSAVPPLVLAAGILTKSIPSRVQLGSWSNRNCSELLLVYSIAYGVCYGVIQFTPSLNDESLDKAIITVVMTFFSIVLNQIFPFALYRTLLADTKFWRGLGRHNAGGIRMHEDLRTSGISVHRPTIDLSIVSSTLQNMMMDIRDIYIDFAYLQLQQIIGHGSTSEVYSGKFKNRLVAIKLSTPPEITSEVIDEFVAEARIASSLKHVNIVQFVGICVRPPQIAMVFEFCEGGNLKSNLQKNADTWSQVSRLKACIDATRAIEHLHDHEFIHRDLKAENFFVGRKKVVKLGDFGESTRFRSRESAQTKRMTILGTVAFMAPELIAAQRHYDESVDLYALAITYWEIWTGKEPYEDVGQFQIYEQVQKGQRPMLPDNAPAGFNDVLTKAWDKNPEERPPATQLVAMLTKVLNDFKLIDGDSGGDAATPDDNSNSEYERDSSMQSSMFSQASTVDMQSDVHVNPLQRVSSLGIIAGHMSGKFESGPIRSTNSGRLSRKIDPPEAAELAAISSSSGKEPRALEPLREEIEMKDISAAASSKMAEGNDESAIERSSGEQEQKQEQKRSEMKGGKSVAVALFKVTEESESSAASIAGEPDGDGPSVRLSGGEADTIISEDHQTPATEV